MLKYSNRQLAYKAVWRFFLLRFFNKNISLKKKRPFNLKGLLIVNRAQIIL